MSISLGASLNQRIGADAAGSNVPVVKPNSANDAAKNEKAARDFEAILLTPVLDSLQKTFGGDPEDAKTPGASDYRHMATQALTQAIAERGGIGIAQMILRHLQPPKVSGGG
jgi:Rod binding domain-containing protein